MTPALHIGTCSWKYDSWRGLVYSDAPNPDYLAEYAQKYDCVEVDQWFWSLFGPEKVVLPKSSVVQEYANAVPDTFRFAVKMPHALTLSHFRQKSRGDTPVPNPHFLSIDLLNRTLEHLEPMRDKLGPLMFQFGYLNKQKMPPIVDVYKRDYELLEGPVVVRLHGPDREGIEKETGKAWSKIVEPRDAELDAVVGMLRDLCVRRQTAWVFVNNHFEGCAPRTIERMMERMNQDAN